MAVLAWVLILVIFVKGEEYTSKYDNIDLDEILSSDRLLKNYVNCLMDRGSCTPDGKELKKILPDALNTGCSKCSDHQKKGAKKVIDYLAKNKRDWFDELLDKYDPDGEYRKKYEKEWKEAGLSLD